MSNATCEGGRARRDVRRDDGESAGALAGLQKSYPIAMGLLEAAAESGKAGRMSSPAGVVGSGCGPIRRPTETSTEPCRLPQHEAVMPATP